MMELESEWSIDISNRMEEFHGAHLVCRTHPKITMYPKGSFATHGYGCSRDGDLLTPTDSCGCNAPNTEALEQLGHARNTLVGCFLTCEKCGEENDCSDMDAVSCIDAALAALKGTP